MTCFVRGHDQCYMVCCFLSIEYMTTTYYLDLSINISRLAIYMCLGCLPVGGFQKVPIPRQLYEMLLVVLLMPPENPFPYKLSVLILAKFESCNHENKT